MDGPTFPVFIRLLFIDEQIQTVSNKNEKSDTLMANSVDAAIFYAVLPFHWDGVQKFTQGRHTSEDLTTKKSSL